MANILFYQMCNNDKSTHLAEYSINTCMENYSECRFFVNLSTKLGRRKKKSRNNEKINFKTLVFTNKKKEEYEN